MAALDESAVRELLECPICLEMMGNEQGNEIMAITSEPTEAGYCNHSYHDVCIRQILDAAAGKNEEARCPECRRKILGVQSNLIANTVAKAYFANLEKLKQNAPAPAAVNDEVPVNPAELRRLRDEQIRIAEQLQEERERREEAARALEEKKRELEQFQAAEDQKEDDRAKEMARMATQHQLQSEQKNLENQRLQKLADELKNLKDKESGHAVQLRQELEEQSSRVQKAREAQEALDRQIEVMKEDHRVAIDQSKEVFITMKAKYVADLQRATDESREKDRARAEVETELNQLKEKFDRLQTTLAQQKRELRRREKKEKEEARRIAGIDEKGAMSVIRSTIGTAASSSVARFLGSTIAAASDRAQQASPTFSAWSKYLGFAVGEARWEGGSLVLPSARFEFHERRNIRRRIGEQSPKVSRVIDKGQGSAGATTSRLAIELPLPAYIEDPHPSTTKIIEEEPKPKADDDSDDEGSSREERGSLSASESESWKRNALYYSMFRAALLHDKLKHPHIAKLVGVVRPTHQAFQYVLPFAGHDLQHLARAAPAQHLTMPQVQSILYRIVCALNYLHSAELVHRNLSVNSFHVHAEYNSDLLELKNLKLVDLSTVRSLRPPFLPRLKFADLFPSTSIQLSSAYRDPVKLGAQFQPELDGLADSSYHMARWAPELVLLQIESYHTASFDWKKVDVWALGILLAELLRGEPIFTQTHAEKLFAEFMSVSECRPRDPALLKEVPYTAKWDVHEHKPIVNLVDFVPATLKDMKTPSTLRSATEAQRNAALALLRRLLAYEPERRPTMNEVLHDPFFDGIARDAEAEAVPSKSTTEQVSDDALHPFVHHKCGGV